MKHKLVFIIMGIIVLLGSTILIFGSNKEYLHHITLNETIKKIENKESFILYIKQDQCSHCLEFTPIFKKVLGEYEIDAYYISLDDLTNEQKTYTKEDVTINDLNITIDGTPTVVFIDKGVETSKLNRIVGSQQKNNIVQKLKTVGYIK